jgi:hypothetical protein
MNNQVEMKVSEGWRFCCWKKKVNINDYCAEKIIQLQKEIKEEINEQKDKNSGIGFLIFNNENVA